MILFLFSNYFLNLKTNSPASSVVKENEKQCFAVKFQKCFGGCGTGNTGELIP